MFSVLVTGEASERNRGTFTVPRGRYLEYTDDTIASQLRLLSHEAIECLKAWPCLLMQEGTIDEPAYLVQVAGVSDIGGSIKFILEPLAVSPPLINDSISKIRTELDLEQFEFHRHHFAVKDRDLLAALGRANVEIKLADLARFVERPLPAPSRAQLIKAIDGLAALSHTEIDRFLLEAGVDGLAAPREGSSRKDRATAIVQFAMTHPSATTAENRLLSLAIVATSQQQPAGADHLAPMDATDSRSSVSPASNSAYQPRNRVFVVHGRNEAARTKVVAFLSKVGLHAIVLHEQANMGRHLLTKFIDEAELVTFAVVLMTDDDVGGEKGGAVAPRARQNVILELGYFLARLGQANVCAIKTPGLETPSDFDGIAYIGMDASGDWETQLLRELKAAHLPVREDGVVNQTPR